ncbi:hypothetical protein TELCIR_08589 [Teladorsagia circumcincta]|uniref:Reverse transcriptase domain-containing protein n=1 Tax=Teladorsagia circumcincta TaxID=45464 RepID=A0A2G9UH51_TELCI|nr:hypothetical protein TELCIR_08589 [Teladorsagia circumcincta]
MADYGFEVRLDQCAFSKPEIRYLGFILDKNGRRPDSKKIEAIWIMKEPKNFTQLRVLGMVTYYSAFLPSMKDLRGLLDALLKKDTKWKWSFQEQDALGKLKAALSSETSLIMIHGRKLMSHVN